MRNLLIALAPLALLCSLAAQGTIIVDAAGGGDFTEIQPAVDASTPGDVIRIRHGDYQPFAISKNATVLGETWQENPGNRDDAVRILGVVTINDLQREQSVVITGLRSGLPIAGFDMPMLFRVTDCEGSVYFSYNSLGSIEVRNSSHVVLHRWTVGSATISGSKVWFYDGLWGNGSGPVITLDRSDAWMVRTNVGFLDPNSSERAIKLTTSSNLTYTLDSAITGACCAGPVPSLEIINSTATERVNTFARVDTDFENRLVVELIEPLQTQAVALAASIATLPRALPEGEWHLDESSLQILHLGPMPVGLKLRKPVFLPPDLTPSRHFDQSDSRASLALPGARLRGVPITFQAAFLVNGKLELSLPYSMVL